MTIIPAIPLTDQKNAFITDYKTMLLQEMGLEFCNKYDAVYVSAMYCVVIQNKNEAVDGSVLKYASKNKENVEQYIESIVFDKKNIKKYKKSIYYGLAINIKRKEYTKTGDDR